MSWTRSLSFSMIAVLSLVARGNAQTVSGVMDGVWKPLSAEFAGREYPKQILESMKLTVKEGKYDVEAAGKRDQGTVKTDSDKSPRTMDITGTDGPNKGKTFLAIYEWMGDDLRVCYNMSGNSRPTEFSTRRDTQLFLALYRRQKP